MNKRILRLLPAIGMFFILAGYLYFSYAMVRSNAQIRENKRQIHQNDSIIFLRITEIDSLERIKSKLLKDSAQLAFAYDTISGIATRLASEHHEKKIAATIAVIHKDNKTLLNSSQTDLVQQSTPAESRPAPNYVVYIQVDSKLVSEEMTRLQLLEKLKERLGADYTIYGYDVEEGRASNEIRYFHPEDLQEAQNLQTSLQQIDPKREMKLSYVGKFGRKVPTGQLELWVR